MSTTFLGFHSSWFTWDNHYVTKFINQLKTGIQIYTAGLAISRNWKPPAAALVVENMYGKSNQLSEFN